MGGREDGWGERARGGGDGAWPGKVSKNTYQELYSSSSFSASFVFRGGIPSACQKANNEASNNAAYRIEKASQRRKPNAYKARRRGEHAGVVSERRSTQNISSSSFPLSTSLLRPSLPSCFFLLFQRGLRLTPEATYNTPLQNDKTSTRTAATATHNNNNNSSSNNSNPPRYLSSNSSSPYLVLIESSTSRDSSHRPARPSSAICIVSSR